MRPRARGACAVRLPTAPSSRPRSMRAPSSYHAMRAGSEDTSGPSHAGRRLSASASSTRGHNVYRSSLPNPLSRCLHAHDVAAAGTPASGGGDKKEENIPNVVQCGACIVLRTARVVGTAGARARAACGACARTSKDAGRAVKDVAVGSWCGRGERGRGRGRRRRVARTGRCRCVAARCARCRWPRLRGCLGRVHLCDVSRRAP